MSNDDVENLIAREDTAPNAPVEEVLDRQREDASRTDPLDPGGSPPAAPTEAPAMADLIDNTGDDGGAASG